MSIYIRSGIDLITGSHSKSGWTLYVVGCNRSTYRKLQDAKDAAIQCGASGNWRREIRKSGQRGSEQTYYYDEPPANGANNGSD